ncbi:MAG: helix-turn-helix transcriptional regulator [Clostridia bacterium]|nr:helix-turn-helix transcriptional regulator [Clostridia bacterium]
MIHQVHNSSGNYNYNAYVYNDVFWDFHFHENYELIYAVRGDVRVTTNGVSHILHEGELLLISPNTVHSLAASNAKTWVGVFSEEYIRAFAKENKYVHHSKFSLSEENRAFLEKNLFYAGKPERYMACACLYVVCDECSHRADAVDVKAAGGFISRVTGYISENLSREITMRDVCEALGYEYHYFSGLFNSTFGMNFKGFVSMYRIGRACSLLTDKDKSITDVASECGFGSIRNFNRVFKRNVGKTPSEYRTERHES